MLQKTGTGKLAVDLKFINLTRRTEIGANCYYLGTGEQGVVLDCGMHPKEEGEMALPLLGMLAGRPVNALLLSHAHLDHIGSLPVLMRQQPQARIFMTEPTAAIGDALLHNSVNVMTREREEVGVDLSALHPSRDGSGDGSVAALSARPALHGGWRT